MSENIKESFDSTDSEVNVIITLRKKGQHIIENVCFYINVISVVVPIVAAFFESFHSKSLFSKIVFSTLTVMTNLGVVYFIRRYPNKMQYAPVVMMSFLMFTALEREIVVSPVKF